MGDFTWGNRFDLGFVDDDSKGWIGTIWHIDGPNVEDIVVTERTQPLSDRWLAQNRRMFTGAGQQPPPDR